MKKLISAIIIFLMIILIRVSYAQETGNIIHAKISADENNWYAIRTDGKLFRIPKENNENAELIPILENVIEVSGNYAIKCDGTLWQWGEYNNYSAYKLPHKVLDDVRNISDGYMHTFAITNNNELFGTGTNYNGNLAQSDMDKNYNTFVKVMDDVIAAKAGGDHSIVLKNDGSVWTFGDGYYGQLGNGTFETNSNIPIEVMKNVKSIFSGTASCFAIKNNEKCELWRWGTNYENVDLQHNSDVSVYYEILPVYYTDNVRSVLNKNGYNLVLKNSGELWAYGDTEDENFEYIHDSNLITPVKIADSVYDMVWYPYLYNVSELDQTMLLKENGDLVLFDTAADGSYIFKNIMRNISTSDEIVDMNFEDISLLSKKQGNAVTGLAKAKIISGTGKNKFSPEKAVTRAETAAMLLRIITKSEEIETPTFGDVDENQWYYNTAGVSVKYGIINGYEDNTFRGDNAVTKLQLITLCARTLKNESFRKIDDAYLSTLSTDGVPDWAQNDVNLALQEGLISEQDLDNADEEISRADAAVILYRLYDKI